jgi:hypothetical protein
LLESEDADAEGDPKEMEKALFEIRKLFAQVSELSRNLHAGAWCARRPRDEV